MTAEAKHLIEDFEKLSLAEQREVLSTLLHAARCLEYPMVAEDELVAAANEVFLGYDQREADK